MLLNHNELIGICNVYNPIINLFFYGEDNNGISLLIET